MTIHIISHQILFKRNQYNCCNKFAEEYFANIPKSLIWWFGETKFVNKISLPIQCPTFLSWLRFSLNITLHDLWCLKLNIIKNRGLLRMLQLSKKKLLKSTFNVWQKTMKHTQSRINLRPCQSSCHVYTERTFT